MHRMRSAFRGWRGMFLAEISSNTRNWRFRSHREQSTTDHGDYNSPAMSFLRFLMLLSLVLWIGGLIFFAFVLAPTAFQVLPSTHLAGNLVGRALNKLHWIAIISGIVFLIASLLFSYLTQGMAHVFATRHILICLMLALTLFSQFWI